MLNLILKFGSIVDSGLGCVVDSGLGCVVDSGLGCGGKCDKDAAITVSIVQWVSQHLILSKFEWISRFKLLMKNTRFTNPVQD